MSEHYYTQKPASKSRETLIKVHALGNTLEFYTDAGVFSRYVMDYGTHTLLSALPELNGNVLDMGCGWGAVGVSVAAKYPETRVTMADVNERAVELAKRNARLNNCYNVTVAQSDGFVNLDMNTKFDFILTNPPIRAGKAVIYALFEKAREYLKPGGELYIVIRKQQGAPSALKFLKGIYASAEMIARDAGYWVIRARGET